MSQILIFIGWYSAPESQLNRWFCPFFKFDLGAGNEGLIDAEVPKTEESQEPEQSEISEVSEVSDKSAGIKEE